MTPSVLSDASITSDVTATNSSGISRTASSTASIAVGVSISVASSSATSDAAGSGSPESAATGSGSTSIMQLVATVAASICGSSIRSTSRAAATVRISSSRSTGLDRKPLQPASRHFCSSPFMALPVRAMIGSVQPPARSSRVAA